MEYRKEIDGLRAIAVIPVIFFHAGFQVFSGGFVGVDVFFVISGYLITTIILTEKEKGIFSIVDFYERRARRILPALFTVMLVSLIVSWFSLSPDHMQDFSQSLVSVSLFSSNIFFWLGTGYWDVENELKPLLHTWSLAVEEQYYVIFPLFLMLMWRFHKRWIFISFVVIAVSSLATAQYGSNHFPTAAFFLLPTRAWELAIGAGIAFFFLYRKKAMHRLLTHSARADILSMVGLGMIAYGVFYFDENTPFPGLYALVPTIGTGLLIVFSSSKTIVGRMLGTNGLVGLGLISYSAYLWHQPLFAFARQLSLTTPTPATYGLLSIASIFLAYLSWRFVEKPFRQKGNFSQVQIFSFAIIFSSLFIATGIAGGVYKGWPDRVNKDVLSSVQLAKENISYTPCATNNPGEFLNDSVCMLAESGDKFVYLYGDSHARVLSNELKKAIDQTDYGLLYSYNRACPPVENVYILNNKGKRNCYKSNKKIYAYIQQNPDIEFVILAARWTIYVESSRFNNEEGGLEAVGVARLGAVDEQGAGYSPNGMNSAEVGQQYIASIKKLLDTGKKVILVYPIPEAGWNVPDFIEKYYWKNPGGVFSETTGSTSYEVFKHRNARTFEALDNIGEHSNLYRVYPHSLFCDSDIDNRCIVQKSGRLLYGDDDHVSNSGAKEIIKLILPGLK